MFSPKLKLSGNRSLMPPRSQYIFYTFSAENLMYILNQSSRQKKFSKKRPPAALEQSSLYEDVVEPNLPKIDDMMARVAEKRRGEQEELESKRRDKSSDKENSRSESENSESPRKKASVKGSSSESKVGGEKSKKVVGRTYGKKGQVSRGSKEDENDEDEGSMSKKKVLAQNTISKKPPAATKQVGFQIGLIFEIFERYLKMEIFRRRSARNGRGM